MTRRKALLLGGTGAMGVYLAQYLAESGWDVTVTSRSRHQNTRSVTYVQGNAKDPAFLSELMKRHWDSVVDFMLWDTGQFRLVHKELLAKCGHYVFLSSYRVYADSPVITEESPRLLDACDDAEYLATDEYALAKARQEDMLRASGHGNYTIVRPSITYSHARFQICTLESEEWLWRHLRKARIALPTEMLSKQTTLTWAGDAAWFIARLSGNEKSYGEAFNVVTSEHMTWRQVVETYNAVLPSPIKIQETSVEQYIDIVRARYRVIYDRMFDRVLDNTKILQFTGRSQNTLKPLHQGLADELKPFLEHPTFRTPGMRLQGRMDAITHDWTLTTQYGPTGIIKYLAGRFID